MNYFCKMNHIERLKEFLRESPNDCFLKHALALEYIKRGEEEKAQKLFEENLAYDKNYIATYYHLGSLLVRNKQPEAAAAIFRQGMAVAKAAGDMHSLGELNNALMLLEDTD
jgi:Tfp pilus assembly protein PilF